MLTACRLAGLSALEVHYAAVDVLTKSGVEGGNVPAYHWHTPRPASGSLWNYDDETFRRSSLKANPGPRS